MKKSGRMNKILSFVLSLVLVLSMTVVSVPNEVEAASASGTVTVSANKTELHRGEMIHKNEAAQYLYTASLLAYKRISEKVTRKVTE